MNQDKEYCLIQALDTYKEYLWEYIGEIGTDEEIQEHIDRLSHYLFEEEYYEEKEVLITETSIYTSLHSNKYEKENCDSHLGYMVVAKGNGKTLILDGNHRKNTFSQLKCNCVITVIIVDAFVP